MSKTLLGEHLLSTELSGLSDFQVLGLLWNLIQLKNYRQPQPFLSPTLTPTPTSSSDQRVKANYQV